MKRVKRFGVLQTAKTAAVIYFLVSLVIFIPLGLIFTVIGGFSGREMPFMPFAGGFMFFFVPFFYAIAGFVVVAVGCLVYNLVAQWTGGIELEIDMEDSHQTHP